MELELPPKKQSTFAQFMTRKRWQLGGGVVAALAITALIIVLVSSGSNNSATNTPTTSKPKFANQLTPASEIKVGDYRYVSPCQVLPSADAQAIFGNLPADGYIAEDALAVSVPIVDSDHGLNSVQTYCNYEYSTKDIDEVTLDAEQFKDPNDVKDIATQLTIDADTAEKTIDDYKQNASGDAKSLVTTMETSLANYKKLTSDDNGGKADGLVLPGESGGITVVHGNVVYTVDVKGSDANDKDTKTGAQLEQLAKAVKVITANAANTHLDQSPAQTILGSSDSVGSTKVIDSCAMLTTDIFKAATSTDENDVVEHTTPQADFSQPTHSVTGEANAPSSECKRQHQDMQGGAVQSIYADLSISYDASDTAAKQTVSTLLNDPNGTKGTALQTAADEAYMFPASSGGSADDSSADTGFYEFRVGAYVGSITIVQSSTQSLSDDFVDTDATQGQYIQAINLIAAQIHKLEQR